MAAQCSDPGGYVPPLSLWKLVEENVCPEEQEEIRNMLGASLIETTLDLHNEVDVLVSIWQDCQDYDGDSSPALAEPPNVRERLIKEIAFLAENIKEKSLQKGMNPTELLSRHNSQILDYAEVSKRSGSTSLASTRPSSSRSSEGLQTPFSPSEEASSRALLSSAISEDIQSTNDKLNYMEFDQVCHRLRETLMREAKQLEADVAYLQSCLDAASATPNTGGTPTLSREPTIAELREERTLLERDLMSTESLPGSPSVKRPAFQPTPPPSTMRLQKMAAVSPKLRPSPQLPHRESSRTSPLKASHHLPCTLPQPDTLPTPSPPSTFIIPSGDGDDHATLFHSTNRELLSNLYDVHNSDIPSSPERPSSFPSSSSDQSDSRGSVGVRRTPNRRRMVSPARGKVVAVASVLDPQTSSRSPPLMPTPPLEAKPQIPRPSSAARFRKMVFQYRETT